MECFHTPRYHPNHGVEHSTQGSSFPIVSPNEGQEHAARIIHVEISGLGQSKLCIRPLSRYSDDFQRLSLEPPYISVGQNNLHPLP